MNTAGPSDGALAGITVIELTHAIAGPQCGQILADHGAHVIKVEPPAGDFSRGARPIVDGDSVYFACHNRGKRSVVLDLKDEADRLSFDKLLSSADVLLTNYSADVPARLGFGFDQLSTRFPRLVVAHITGFGITSADRAVRAYDGIVQSMSGIPASTGSPGTAPVLASAFVADHIAAYHAALGIMFALRERDRTGEGSLVDISMLDAYASTSAHFLQASVSGQEPVPVGNRVATAFSSTFAARDGDVYLAPIGAGKWATFCGLLEIDDPQLTDYQQMLGYAREPAYDAVAEWCRERDRDDIVALMQQYGIPCGPVLTSRDYAMRALREERLLRVSAPDGPSYWTPGPVGNVGLTSDPRRAVVPPLGGDTEHLLERPSATGR
ncbi:CaiB/BaiF CoA transferase family protein [Cumulibacter manganitolerans]|uniref:CaiB/BaiF CoA transferase family protein n=1 Tax=Cumulibacter manganitolerans TaxID=1884992 RepID=UPI001885FEEF|nr:CoA transferase [Cumulibacter manganitolerans]